MKDYFVALLHGDGDAIWVAVFVVVTIASLLPALSLCLGS